ncbi:MAG: DUF559 domain-containing protein [Pirellulales bacterium]
MVTRRLTHPFEAEVSHELSRQGLEVRHQVGCSGYRIDLALVDPQRPGRYVLGIECDGASYHSSVTARDRDRLRQEVLEGLGWKLCRIWSTDWVRDPQQQVQRVLNAYQTALGERADDHGEPAVNLRREQVSSKPSGTPNAVDGQSRDKRGGSRTPDHPAVTVSSAEQRAIRQQQEAQSTARQRRDEEEVERAAEVAAATWRRLAEWVRQNGNNSRDIRLLREMEDQARRRKMPTPDQAARSLLRLREACKHGFQM